MTFFFPDLSQYNDSVHIESGTVAVIARATLSDRIADTEYIRFKSEAAQQGALFVAYHWLNHGNIPAQAQWAYSHVGSDVPLMLDCEDMSGNTGYNGALTVDDIHEFVLSYRALGGVCHLVYLPAWYWSGHMGSPNLATVFTAQDLYLVSSNYTGYSDNGPGWDMYGGVTPLQWQYTASFSYGGDLSNVDMNACKASVFYWWDKVSGGMAMASIDDIAAKVGWIDPRVEGIAELKQPTTGAEKGKDLPFVVAFTELCTNVQALANGGVALTPETKATLDGFTAAVNALIPHLK